jgi:hypothetical protein
MERDHLDTEITVRNSLTLNWFRIWSNNVEIKPNYVLYVAGCRPDSLHVIPPHWRLLGGGDLTSCYQAI